MSLNIKLIDNWYLKSDSHNFIIQKEGCKPRGYFQDIESAINSFLIIKIRGFNSESIESLLKEINALQVAVGKAVEPLNLEVVQKNE